MQIKLRKFGAILISRQLGKEAFLAFSPTLRKAAAKEKIELDFEGVMSFSPSWAEEFLRPLSNKYKKRLVLKNTDNISVKTTLEFLERNVGLKFNIVKIEGKNQS